MSFIKLRYKTAKGNTVVCDKSHPDYVMVKRFANEIKPRCAVHLTMWWNPRLHNASIDTVESNYNYVPIVCGLVWAGQN